jgi:hypothetical protein
MVPLLLLMPSAVSSKLAISLIALVAFVAPTADVLW